ncbi:MAG: hypothetical protein LBS33_05505, partial [Streptococcaceae bacterium]|nr:hypothetical protein [Streptococcaceae bacterium]
MKKIKLTKRRLAGGAILLVAALLGVFSGTYAKYLSTIDLPKTDDQTGNVAVWQVGQSVVMGNLFAPYYYGSDVEDGSGDAGHTAPQESSDTVFAKGIYNLVAPGTKGEKTIQLVDKLDDTKGETEVAYKVEFSNPGSEINGGKIVNFTNDTDGKLASRLQFKLLIAKNEKDEGKTSLWNVKTSGLDGWTNAAGLEEALKAQTLWYNGSAFDYSIKIMWQWPFETDDLANTSDMLAQATSASLSVSFGTARYEQVDSYEPVQTGLKIEWDTTIQEFKVEIAGESWIVLHQEGDKALVIRDTVLTVKEATSVINEGDKEYQTPLIDDAANPKYFFSSTGENGYLTSPVYKAIEHYYTNSIVASGDDKYVVAVNLNTPTFEEFRTTPFAPKLIPYPYPSPSGDVAYNNWEWSSDILKGELDYF